MAAFFTRTFYGRYSSKFSDSEEDFSTVDEHISPSDGHQTLSYNSTSADKDYEDPTDRQSESWPPPRRVLRVLPQCSITVESHTNSKYSEISHLTCVYLPSTFSAWHLNARNGSRL